MSQNSDTGTPQGLPPPTLSALQTELAETRRRLAEAEQIVASLPENERFFRNLFEQSVVGMARVSVTTGRFVRVNIALCHLVGYSMDELEQLAPGDITFADDREAHAEAVAAMRRGETDAYDLQKRYVHKDGNLIWVHVRAALVRDAQGNPEATFSTIEDLTASKATGAALRASEARFRASFENSSLAMSIISQDKVAYQDVNKVCAELFGLTREAMLGRSPAELGLYADPDTTQKTLRSLLQRDGFVHDHEVLWRAKGGKLRWHLLSADPIVMEGEPCLFVVSHDITEHKEAEALLREKDAFNLAALEASPDCLKVVNADGRIEYLNGNGVCLLELDDCAAVLGEKWETLWPASEHPTIHTAIATALAGEAVNFTATGPSAKGTPKVWDVSVAPVPAIDGPPTKLIVASRDVTELAENMERLRASEARYLAAIKAVGGTVWTNNAYGEMYGEQPGWSALTGQTLAEYQGFGWARAVHPDDAQPTIDAWNAAVATSSEFDFEHRVRRHDGEWRHFRIRAAPIFDREGNVAEWVGMHRDITEQRAREAHNHLLMAEVNHRSKNLLGVVMAVARQTGGGDHAQFMRSFADRIQSLAAGQDLLVTSQWQGVVLEDLVRAQLSHFSELIGGRITLDGGAVRVSAAAAQTIGMAMHELATNASKYGALSADRGRIAIAWHLSDGISLDRRFVMTWTESDGPPVVVPKRTGFGSTVIGRMAKMSLDCETSADFLPSGFSWRMDCPVEKIMDESVADRMMNREIA